MSTKGTSAQIPLWWIDDVKGHMNRLGLKQADLAARIAGAREGGAFDNWKARLSKFFSRQVMTFETADAITGALAAGDESGGDKVEVLPYSFTPNDRQSAEALHRHPDEVIRGLLYKEVLDKLLSGHTSLDELIRAASSSSPAAPEKKRPPKPGRH